MKKLILLFCFFSIFSVFVFGQNQATYSKGSFVVPKFNWQLAGVKGVSVWSGKTKLTTSVSQTADGQTTVNGRADWKDAGWAFTIEYTIREIKKSSKGTLVKLQHDPYQIEVNFDPSIKDLNKVMNEVFYAGNVNSFKQTDYYQTEVVDRFLPRIFKGVLVAIPEKDKLEMMEKVSYDIEALGIFDYKEKQYLRCLVENNTAYNTRVVSDSQRTSTVIKSKLLEPLKYYYEKIKKVNGVDGLKMIVTVFYRDFITEPTDRKDTLELYVPKTEIGQFIDADITSQELMNKSIILLNGNRVQVDLNNSVSN